MSKMKKILIPLAAVILAFAGDYLNYVVYDLLPEFDSGFKNNIIHPVLVWLFTYGVMLAFGLIYYGKNKKALRFPLAYAFGFSVEQALWAIVKMVVNLINSADTGMYVDASYFYAGLLFIGAGVSLVVLYKSVNHEALLCESAELQDGEIPSVSVRNRIIYGNKAYAKITVIVFSISFLVVRLSVRLGYLLAVRASSYDDAVSQRADIVDVAVCFAEIIVCYLISLGFCENKKGAFYFLQLYLFAGAVSSVFDGFSRYIISSVTEALNVAEIYATDLLYSLPVVIGDVIAIIISVMIVKRLVGKKVTK